MKTAIAAALLLLLPALSPAAPTEIALEKLWEVGESMDDEVLFGVARSEALGVDQPGEGDRGAAASAGFAVAVDAPTLCRETCDEGDAAADGVDVR